MSKRKKKRRKAQHEGRNAIAYAARILCRAETIPDRRTRRLRTRAAQERAALKEQS
jgi:hypothetical protein